MKKFHQYIVILAAAALTACSSLEVDESEEYSENFPADFVDSVYMELHPVLRSAQIADYVKERNAAFKDSLGAEKYKEKSEADMEKFLADTVQLRKIYTDPYLVGFSDDYWEEEWGDVEEKKITTKTIKEYKAVLVYKGTDTTKVFLDSTVFDENGNFKTLYGYVDEVTKAPVTYEIGAEYSVASVGATFDEKEVSDTTVVKSSGQLGAISSSLLSNFNLYDTEDDYEAVKKAPLDMWAIAYQYLFFGKSHGWAYRYCKDSEKKNAEQLDVVYPVTSDLFCYDADEDVVRKIK